MPSTLPSPEHYVAAEYARSLVHLVGHWGVAPHELLACVEGEWLEAIYRQGVRMDIATFGTLVGRASALTATPAIGFHLGLDARLSSHGCLGFAAMAVPTVRDAIEVATRFLPTRTNAFRFRFVETATEGALVVDELCDLGSSRDAIVVWLLVGVARFVRAASFPARIGGSLDFAFERPSYLPEQLPSELMNMAIRFDQPHHRVRCDAAALDTRLPNANPEAVAIAREQCERELMALGIGDDVVQQVRATLPHPQGGYRSLNEVARRLGYSERTLKRRLATQGTSFSVIVSEVRAEAAKMMLTRDDSSLDEIGERLGYAHASAFSKAFRRWTGLSPREFRNLRSVERENRMGALE